jgi:hypothetical protein
LGKEDPLYCLFRTASEGIGLFENPFLKEAVSWPEDVHGSGVAEAGRMSC